MMNRLIVRTLPYIHSPILSYIGSNVKHHRAASGRWIRITQPQKMRCEVTSFNAHITLGRRHSAVKSWVAKRAQTNFTPLRGFAPSCPKKCCSVRAGMRLRATGACLGLLGKRYVRGAFFAARGSLLRNGDAMPGSPAQCGHHSQGNRAKSDPKGHGPSRPIQFWAGRRFFCVDAADERPRNPEYHHAGPGSGPFGRAPQKPDHGLRGITTSDVFPTAGVASVSIKPCVRTNSPCRHTPVPTSEAAVRQLHQTEGVAHGETISPLC